MSRSPIRHLLLQLLLQLLHLLKSYKFAERAIPVYLPIVNRRLTCRTSATPIIAIMCNVPSGAETYAKLYESVSSDGVSLTLLTLLKGWQG